MPNTVTVDEQTMTWRQPGVFVVDGLAQHRMHRRLQTEIVAALNAGRHYWIALVAYAVTVPLVKGSLLDQHSMREPPLVGCYICETEYAPGMETTHCQGVVQ